ncbi:transcriptional regulator [Pigmentiphaga litoralis]|nr:transcriptional regulator [Pigmentiphaga litoralis]
MGAMHDAPNGSALCTPTLRFDSANFHSPAEAFDRWRDMLAPVYDVSRPSAAELIRFHAQLTAMHLGPALISYAVAAAQHCQRSSTTIARSQVDHLMAHTCLEGGYHGVTDGRAFQVSPGDVGIFDLSRTWHATCKPFRHLSLLLPRTLLEPLLTRPDRAHGTVLSGATPAGRLLCEHLQSLWRNLPQLTQDDAQRVLLGSASLIAGCLGPTQGAHESPVRAASFARIRRYVDTNLTRPDLNAEQVCDRFGLSRSTLFRLFAPFGGFAHYVRDQRLRACFRDIASPAQAHRRISDIAEHWCFNNEAVFSRAFRRLFDASPRDVRQAALAWATLPEHYAPRSAPAPSMTPLDTAARMS